MSAKVLHPFHLSSEYKLTHLQPQPGIDIDSPAKRLMLDFRLHPALTLPPTTPVEEAQHTIKNSHSSVVLVVDRFERLCGVVTKNSISNQAIIKKVGQGRGRDDLQVGDFVLPSEMLTAVSLAEIENANVAKVITLLRNEGAFIVLVVDHDTKEVVGLLSATEIEEILGLELNLPYIPSFLDIFEAVMH